MQRLLHQDGFTLLEVLIALVILAIAFSTVYLSLSAATYHLVSLQDKTAAEWVGLNVMAKAQAGLIPPEASGTEKMFQTNWQWHLSFSPSADPYVLHTMVTVNKEGRAQRTIQLEGYLSNRL